MDRLQFSTNNELEGGVLCPWHRSPLFLKRCLLLCESLGVSNSTAEHKQNQLKQFTLGLDLESFVTLITPHTYFFTHLTNNCSWLLTRHDTTVAPVGSINDAHAHYDSRVGSTQLSSMKSKRNELDINIRINNKVLLI